jgi:hypothetical protein
MKECFEPRKPQTFPFDSSRTQPVSPATRGPPEEINGATSSSSNKRPKCGPSCGRRTRTGTEDRLGKMKGTAEEQQGKAAPGAGPKPDRSAAPGRAGPRRSSWLGGTESPHEPLLAGLGGAPAHGNRDPGRARLLEAETAPMNHLAIAATPKRGKTPEEASRDSSSGRRTSAREKR